jgi:hypothetical protein
MGKKETTIDDLAVTVDNLVVTVDKLAVMVARGFDEIRSEISGGLKGVKTEISELREQNKSDHLELKLRQDNVAYRFELESLDKRVTHLEKKIKLA